jgi:hypothetical protein
MRIQDYLKQKYFQNKMRKKESNTKSFVSPTFEELFWSHSGDIVHKWIHYLPIYQQFFQNSQGQPVRMLEIGVSKGGSLDMWRKFFGDEAVIFGIDIDPECKKFNDKSAQVRIGSQDDRDFLKSVVDEMGGVDIVLDDGSHVSSHIRTSFEVLFPLLSENGTYMIEDLHAAYWENYGGGYQTPKSFFTDISQMVDDMHHWHHPHGQKIDACANSLASLHVYDSVVVLNKSTQPKPRHVRVGT